MRTRTIITNNNIAENEVTRATPRARLRRETESSFALRIVTIQSSIDTTERSTFWCAVFD